MVNIIQDNFLKNNINHELTLVLFNTELHDSIFFKKSLVKNIFNLTNFKETYRFLKKIYSIKSNKAVINLSSKTSVKYFLGLLNRRFLNITIIPTIENLTTDARKILEFINKISGDNLNRVELTPRYHITEAVIEKSKEYIDWIMTSSGFRGIDHVNYLYLFLDSDKLEHKSELMKILSTYLDSASNLGLIFSFSNFNKKSVDDFFNEMQESLVKKVLSKQFTYCDTNLIISLIRKSQMFITDNEIYHHFSVQSDLTTVLLNEIENETEKISQLNNLKNNLLYIKTK